MTPERWQQIEKLYHVALELAPAARDALLSQACVDDEELRREVESLLASHYQAASFIESSPDDVVAGMMAEEQSRSMLGRTLGHYRISSLLGAGGMGEVYRARDLRLDRDVAVKILPEHLAGDAEALRRFEREAKAIAALSHPNILSIFDFGTEAGISYAVMELLEGENLRSRLVRSAMGWREAVEVGIAITEGLAAAHAKGIIHRDLKPENIFLTTDGYVKILDFGIARVKRTILPDSKTLTSASETTRPGMVMGTIGYMSPEQVGGQTADAPSDIFSFGCVLYELVSGKKPFARESVTETIAAILRDEPPALASLAETNKPVPAELERVIRRCLEKRPQNRFQSARDLASDLRRIFSGSGNATSRSERVHQPLLHRSRLVAVTAAGLALLLIGVVAWFYWASNRQRAIDSHAVLPSVVASGNAAGIAPGQVEILSYYLEAAGSTSERLTGAEPLAAGQLFKFHFIPKRPGFLYIIAAGEKNSPTTFLTSHPVPASGVITNKLEADTDFSFPGKDAPGIVLGQFGSVTPFTVIFSPTPLTKPGFLVASANRQLNQTEQRELETFWQQYGQKSPAMKTLGQNQSPSVAVSIPTDQTNGLLLIFDIALKRR